jgi:hypothetical protein
MTTVFLDSNIYRQFGKTFTEHQDFIRLKDFLDKTHNEFGLIDIVEKEIHDFLTLDIYGQIDGEFTKLRSTLDKNPFIESDLLPDISKKIDEGLAAAKKQLEIHKFRLAEKNYPAEILVDFLLANKRVNGKKDNTRDFLITHNLFVFCSNSKDNQVVFISDDAFFTENKFVQELKAKHKIQNLHVFRTIPDFLKEFGPQFEFVTEELVLGTVSKAKIESELQKDSTCFPSYVSRHYHETKPEDLPNIESLEIGDIRVHDYYVTKKLDSDNYLIQFSLAVPIKALYKPEKDIDALLKYQASNSKIRPYHSEAFDEEHRPIFEHKVLFIYEGNVNQELQELQEITFIDFFPDHFLWEEYKEKVEQERKTLSPQFLCSDGEKHTFDTEHGFYKNSQYGGGLSWHYRCTKCGILYDTGDYFD